MEKIAGEVAYIAYHFHWSLDDILEMEHSERHNWIQEISEISFRNYMREYAPQFQLLEPLVNLDDQRISYEAVVDMLASND